jgi:16S rRNA (guanine966-N2)-methyltransferase
LSKLRISGGEFRGRLIEAPRRGDPQVRPTTEKAREAVFSILGPVDGLRVLDLFAGTGALAFEALSRGASEATLVDLRPGLARRNAESLGLEGRAQIVRKDALGYLSRAPEHSFDLVLCDPPYGLDRRIAEQLGPELVRALRPKGRLMIESSPTNPIEVELPLLRERRYGDTLIRVHTTGEEAE